MTRLALALTLMAAPAAAQENIVLQTFNTVTSFAPPPWVTSADTVIAESEVFQDGQTLDSGSQIYILELIPKGQSFDSWSELSALLVQTKAPDVPDLYRTQLGIYEQVCTTIDHEHIVDLQDHHTGVILCGSYKDNPTMGEAFVVNFIKRQGTSIKTYYHKRGPAFDVTDPASYPLSLDRIADIVADLAATGVYPVTE